MTPGTNWATTLITAVGAYAACGVLFGACFLSAGLARVDPIAARAGPAFRLLLLPGTICLWPLLLRAWTRSAAGARE